MVRKQDYFKVEVTEPLAASALQTVPVRNSANNPCGTQHASDAPNRNVYIKVQLQQKMCYSVVHCGSSQHKEFFTDNKWSMTLDNLRLSSVNTSLLTENTPGEDDAEGFKMSVQCTHDMCVP